MRLPARKRGAVLSGLIFFGSFFHQDKKEQPQTCG